MTVNDLIDVMIPLLGIALLIIGIVIGVQFIGIACRVKKILERVDTISDVSGWLALLKKWPSRKKNNS